MADELKGKTSVWMVRIVSLGSLLPGKGCPSRDRNGNWGWVRLSTPILAQVLHPELGGITIAPLKENG